MNSLPPTASGTSTRPYLVRALHEWCNDNGFTPYIAVYVDETVKVPAEYVKNNEIVLNISFEATTGLKLGNDLIEFKARFGGRSQVISVPVSHVIAIYARENGQGMAFPTPSDVATTGGGETAGKDASSRAGAALRLADTSVAAESETAESSVTSEPPPEGSTPGGRPSLKRIK